MRREVRSGLLPAGLALVAAILLIAGCGSDDDGATTSRTTSAPTTDSSQAPVGTRARACRPPAGTDVVALRAVAEPCAGAEDLARSWSARASCARPEGARFACSVGGYRCLGVRAGRGLAVSCAASGRSVSFIVGRGS